MVEIGDEKDDLRLKHVNRKKRRPTSDGGTEV
uniref:Transposase n=1 Tax=Heterorhabditis bacteriophora TaxID=37862 RepID=A0A1I7XEP1_HETBA